MSCEPSSLISAIHRNLPYFTNNPFEGVNLTNATITVDNILEDLLVVTACLSSILSTLIIIIIVIVLFSVQECGRVSFLLDCYCS